jgi:protein involved in temperature-dependent protein secretion
MCDDENIPMAVDPQVLQALEGAVRADPSNRALRLHLIDLLLSDFQHAAALGHCEMLLQQSPGDADAQARKRAALDGFGMTSPAPTDPPTSADTDATPPAEWVSSEPEVGEIPTTPTGSR